MRAPPSLFCLLLASFLVGASCAGRGGGGGDDDDDDSAVADDDTAPADDDTGADDDDDGPLSQDDADGDGLSPYEGDCDDDDATRFPGNVETCDGQDNDCDGQRLPEELDHDSDLFSPCEGDCEPFDGSIYPGADELCNAEDDDCDAAVPPDEVDGDGDTWLRCEGDCDDANPGAYPLAFELCDGIDQNCSGAADETFDLDGDGQSTCGPDGSADTGDEDCDDLNPYAHDGAVEFLDGEDNDCDGAIDDAIDSVDGDGDLYSEAQGDCDDTNAAVYPSALEVCDGFDNDCDGTLLDENGDMDGDGPSVCDGDCNDDDATVYPGAAELCWDQQDNDCNGVQDCDEPICNVVGGGNQSPVASAGADIAVTQSVTCTQDAYAGVTCPACQPPLAMLDGSGSFDPDNNLSLFQWALASPPAGVSIPDPNAATPSIVGPPMSAAAVGTQSATTTVGLTVSDCQGASSTDAVTVTWTCNFTL